MARRTPAEVLSSYAAGLSINDDRASTAASSSQPTPIPTSPVISYQPTISRMARASISTTSSTFTSVSTESATSKHFLLADMDGRAVRDNRACSTCIANLSDEEVGQVNWHLAEHECRLCQVAACKPEAFTKPFCDFMTENPTVFHAIDYFKGKLSHAGYQELSARDNWATTIRPGGKYWTARNGSSLIAFNVGKAYKPGNGVGMIASHVDALTARLKPVSTKPTKAGYFQLGVAPYGGALNQTWWDRDLSIGGRVIVSDEATGKTSIKLVKLNWPIAKIPSLAPHFGVGILGQGNKETQAVPVTGLDPSNGTVKEEALAPAGSFVNTQPPKLVKLIAKELGISNYSTIVNWELELYDSQPAQLCGLEKDLLSAGRIDDKLCSWPAIMALIASENGEDDSYIKLVGLFDDEEVGSLLRQGANSNFMPMVIERAVEALSGGSIGPGILGQTYARSFLLSADVSHAGNPNFLGEYLPEHIPRLNVGMVIGSDSNAHLTTDAVSTAILKRVATLAGAKTQDFMIRNDSRSGGTVGPMLSSKMGVRAADAGLPQLSMHSIRATTGSLDPGLGVQFFKGFLDNWEKIDQEWEY